MHEKIWLAAAGFCFLVVFAKTMWAIGAHRYQPSRANFTMNTIGFICLTLFLHFRGQQLGRCPLTNLSEVLIFLSWSTVLTYLVVGPTYRLSLIGAFTAPLVIALLGLALVFDPGTEPVFRTEAINPWLETHAAISLIAYGAFALACIAGAMYLLQDRQLKRRELTSLFYELPPIHTLARANTRLLLFGFSLLTIGLITGFFVNRSTAELKLLMSFGIWIIYGAILATRWLKALAPLTLARLSVAAFLLSLGTLWGMELLKA